MNCALRDPPRLQLSFYSLRLPRFPRESNPVKEGEGYRIVFFTFQH